MKTAAGIVSLILLNYCLAYGQGNTNYFYVSAKGVLTSWQGIGQDHSPDAGVEIGYNISVAEGVRLSPFAEFMFYDHESSNNNATVNRIGFGLRPEYQFEIGEEIFLGLAPGIRLARQKASVGIEGGSNSEKVFTEEKEVTASTGWKLNIEPAVQISIPFNESMRGGLGLFIDLTDLGKSMNKLRYNNQPVYNNTVKSTQIGLIGTFYFR